MPTRKSRKSRKSRTVQNLLLISGMCVAGAGGLAPAAPAWAADAAADAPTTRPAEGPIDPAMQALVTKLASPSAKVRDEASRKLAEMGKAAVPALKELVDVEDPELRSRVKALLRRAERRLPPAAPKRDGRFQSQSVRMSISNGNKTVDVNDNGRKVHIEQTAKGIKMSVTGVEDGKEVTEEYEAKDADELKRDNPEAFALYEKWGEGNGGNIRINAGGLRIDAGAVGRGADGLPAIPDEALNQIREMIKEQVRQGNLPADEQNRILERLNDPDLTDRAIRRRLDERMKELENGRRPDHDGPVPPGDAPAPRPAPDDERPVPPGPPA